MTTVELQKRSEKSQNLRVIQVDETWFYVESEEGKISYKVCYAGEENYCCPCGDFQKGIKNDQTFKCKHVLAVASCVPNGEQEKAQFLERRKPKLDERFITTIEGKDFVLFAGLLDMGHQKGILKIEVEPLQLPSAENGHMAICKATVLSKSGEVYSELGDANPQNCHPRVAKHCLRMASTRALARALRVMTNVGITALEEISDYGDIIDVKSEDHGTRKVAQAPPKKIVRAKETKSIPDKVDNSDKKQESAARTSQDIPLQTQAAPPSGNGNKVTESKEAKKADGNGNGKGRSKQETVPKISSAQQNAIANLSRRRGVSVEELEKLSVDAYGVKVEHLSQKDASSLIRQLQTSS